MLTKRIIPCLDVKDGRVVKGKSFVQLRDAGDPVELARFYYKAGADELVFLDITATPEGRDTVKGIDKTKKPWYYMEYGNRIPYSAKHKTGRRRKSWAHKV